MLDIFAMNDDGNLLDAAAIAAVAALKDAKLPKYDEEEERILYGEWTNKGLPLTEYFPFNMTFHKIGDKIILDPIVEEEESSEARISLAFSQGKINSAQKGNEEPFELSEMFEIFEIAEKKAKEMTKELEEKIEKAIKSKKEK